MREIKFRGWMSETNQMLDAVTLNDMCILNCGCGLSKSTIIEQFTGLQDKNGVEIYEGDKCIVERPCVGAVGVIKFHQGCFIFVENHTENILRLCDLKLNNYTIEVIGNIHANPELLGGIADE